MRISDWSSDVCSSDLKPSIAVLLLDHRRIRRPPPRSPPERRRSAHRETHTMSRIPLTPLDSAAREVPGLEVAVGWDRPLATYFAIVSGEDEPGDEDDEDDADPVPLWPGTTYGDILDPTATHAALPR